MVAIDTKMMIPDYWHRKHQKMFDQGDMVTSLEMNEVGGFEDLELKRDK